MSSQHYNNYLLKKAIMEYRIHKYFKMKQLEANTPSKVLRMILESNSIALKLSREQRTKFILLIKRMLEARRIIQKYRKIYSRKQVLFYSTVFGFSPEKGQKVKISWKPNSIHFIFEKKFLNKFWKKVGMGVAVGAYMCVGDRDIKIRELRGLITFGKQSFPAENKDIVLHESVHLFDDFVKRKKQPSIKRLCLFYDIKSELSAYVHNFREAYSIEQKTVNKKSSQGLKLSVLSFLDDFFSIGKTANNIGRTKQKIKRAKSVKAKEELRQKLSRLNARLEAKNKKSRKVMKKCTRIVGKIKHALQVMPVDALRTIVLDVPFQHLDSKISELVCVYKTAKRTCFLV